MRAGDSAALVGAQQIEKERMLDFTAVDVETANARLASICQIGIATVIDGKVADIWSRIVDPDDIFHPINIRVHGINSRIVRGAPSFSDIVEDVIKRLQGIVVSHTMFDRRSIAQATALCGRQYEGVKWLDSVRMARRAWPEKCARGGFGLANLAGQLGIEFRHHDAAEDARAAAEIALRACADTGMSIDVWLQCLQCLAPTKSGRASKPIRRDGAEEGPFFGEIVVFTGTLTMPRREAADLAAAAGYTVESDVNRQTTLLVVGDRDIRPDWPEKSCKHRKAEALIKGGQEIRIVGEQDFLELLKGWDGEAEEEDRVPQQIEKEMQW